MVSVPTFIFRLVSCPESFVSGVPFVLFPFVLLEFLLHGFRLLGSKTGIRLELFDNLPTYHKELVDSVIHLHSSVIFLLLSHGLPIYGVFFHAFEVNL